MDQPDTQFEQTLRDFIARTGEQLGQNELTLKEYESFFRQCEKAFPAYVDFVSRVVTSLDEVANLTTVIQDPAARVGSAEGRIGEMKISQSKISLTKLPPRLVLVVDDAEINRVLMSHYFKDLPIRLEFSGSGNEAIRLCQRLKDQGKRYDLILMDLQMKDMTGLETAQQIRSFESTTPIFAITNLEPTEAELKSSQESGCNRYLSKALTREALVEEVKSELFREPAA